MDVVIQDKTWNKMGEYGYRHRLVWEGQKQVGVKPRMGSKSKDMNGKQK